MAKGLGFTGDAAVKLADQIQRLYKTYSQWNALAAGFNPLVMTPEGNFFAAGAFLEIDDSALFRFPQLRELSLSRILDPLAREGKTIGCNLRRAGWGHRRHMHGSRDWNGHGGPDQQARPPANFLETAGGSPRNRWPT